MVFLTRPYHFNFFKGCLPQVLLVHFLNTLPYLSVISFYTFCNVYLVQVFGADIQGCSWNQEQQSWGILRETCSENMQQFDRRTRTCQNTISIKLQSNFIEMTFRRGCFLVNFLNIFGIPLSKNTSGPLLLLKYILFLSLKSPNIFIKKKHI